MLTHCLCAWWTIQAGVLLVGSTAFSIVYMLIHSLVRNMPIIKTSVVRLKSPFLVSDFYFTFFLFSLHLVSATNFLNASPFPHWWSPKVHFEKHLWSSVIMSALDAFASVSFDTFLKAHSFHRLLNSISQVQIITSALALGCPLFPPFLFMIECLLRKETN